MSAPASATAPTDLDRLREFAHRAVAASRAAILKHWRDPDLAIEAKGDGSPVTPGDREAEAVLRAEIETSFPEDGIRGEELPDVRLDSSRVWVLDPIDGTIGYIHGSVIFGTLIALLEDGEPVFGVIDLPALDECLIGWNTGAELNGQPIQVRAPRPLEEATVLTGDYRRFATHGYTGWPEVAERTKYVRGWGDAFGYAMLAAGRADATIDPIAEDWDKFALAPVVRGAGGVISDCRGRPLAEGRSILAATNADLQADLVRSLKPAD